MHDQDLIYARPLKDFLPKEMNYYSYITQADKFVINRKNMLLFTKGKVKHMPGRGNFTAVIDSFLSKL
jgi:hypothetical protein